MSLLSRQAQKLCARLDLAQLAPRPRTKLAFVEDPPTAGASLLLDTGVYVHQLKNQTPAALDALVGVRLVNHSVVALQEMLHAVGVLDPADPRTRRNARRSSGFWTRSHRLFAPTQDVMLDAAVSAGVLCRLQGYSGDRRMRALHDCSLLLQARQLGATLLTANVVDFDLLQQMLPEGRVLYYETPRGPQRRGPAA